MHKKYGGDGLVALSVSLDNPQDAKVRARVDEFLQKKQARFTNLIAEGDIDAWYERLKIGGIPAVFVFDRDNRRVKRMSGEELDYEIVEKEAARLLKK
ncbi:MAG TPA: hypothetical protein VMF69_11490 [Gemmataceae bacterium]|nr:hypothetical protein [Gemmataceae bacterium]